LDTTTRPNGPIAVVAQWRKGYARIPVPYVHAVELGGGDARVVSTFPLPPSGHEDPTDAEVVLGLEPSDASCLDGVCGLLLPGGGDIDPALYGVERHPRTHNVSQRRDRFELTLLAEALRRDMPVFAICHGMQLLNIHLGGTLDQHLADDPEHLDHDRDRPRAEPVHDVRVEPGTILAEAMGTAGPVNSHHHQGLDLVSDALDKIAWAEDGVLEAVVAPEYSWVLGVQWHPEAMADTNEDQRRLFELFVRAAAAHAGRDSNRVHARSA
jgi:putative glutamine amidotransferase